MARKAKEKAPPTRPEAVKEVRIFGAIHLALGLYTIVDALAELGDFANLPGPVAAKMVGGVLGIVFLIIAWGPAVASGLGLIFLTQWGRWLAIQWGKIIVWLLPIAFGLSSDGLSGLFSLAFVVIIVIGLYALTVSTNLERPEFDIAFEPAASEVTFVQSGPGKQAVEPDVQEHEAISEKVKFECEECGKRYVVDASLSGRKVKCKECGHKFHVLADSYEMSWPPPSDGMDGDEEMHD